MASQNIDLEEQPPTKDSSPRLSLSESASEPKEGVTEEENYEVETTVTDEYPHGARLAAIVISLMLGMFLVALDNVSSIVFNAPRS